MTFDPSSVGYPLVSSFDRWRIDKLLNQFAGEVRRDIDRKLALELREEVLNSVPPRLSEATFKRLARWCKTDGIYGDAGDVARRISQELFGRVSTERSLGPDSIDPFHKTRGT
jgi:hypothetical protein